MIRFALVVVGAGLLMGLIVGAFTYDLFSMLMDALP